MKTNAHTAKEMYSSYATQKKGDLVQLEKELVVAISDKERVRIQQIAPRMRNQIGIPPHISEQFNHRKAEITKLKRQIAQAKTAKVVDFKVYRDILVRFNLAIIEAALQGYIYTIPAKLGKLSIRKVLRKTKKPAINWAETTKLKNKTGVWKLVYHTSDWWFRWWWEKRSCNIKNETVYSFKPTNDQRTRKGAANKLCKLVTNDPFAHLKFKIA